MRFYWVPPSVDFTGYYCYAVNRIGRCLNLAYYFMERFVEVWTYNLYCRLDSRRLCRLPHPVGWRPFTVLPTNPRLPSTETAVFLPSPHKRLYPPRRCLHSRAPASMTMPSPGPHLLNGLQSLTSPHWLNSPFQSPRASRVTPITISRNDFTVSPACSLLTRRPPCPRYPRQEQPMKLLPAVVVSRCVTLSRKIALAGWKSRILSLNQSPKMTWSPPIIVRLPVRRPIIASARRYCL